MSDSPTSDSPTSGEKPFDLADFQAAADTLADAPALGTLLAATDPSEMLAAVNALHDDGLAREALVYLAVMHAGLIGHLAAARAEDPDQLRATIAAVPTGVDRRRRTAGWRVDPASV